VIKLGIAGGAGRMGQALIAAAAQMDSVYQLVNISVREGRSLAAPAGAKVVASLAELASGVDLVVDFTLPEHSLAIAQACVEKQVAHLCGTTGFSEEQLQSLAGLAATNRMFWAPNTSLGVNVLAHLVERAAGILDDSYDVEIVEMHHAKKVDAPSGTALMLGQKVAGARAVSLDEKAVYTRMGHTGERQRGDIGFATLRGGNVPGEHTVIFAGDNERIELTQKSYSRAIYANGALKAGLWLVKQPAGKLYSMQDFLGL
jgi:4-hydroxy-tetrahydrodipicolinate reductase